MTGDLEHTQGASRRRRGRSVNGLALQLSAIALSFILVALLVITSSRAAFDGQTHNPDNTVTTASISLTDNDGATAMFSNVTDLAPGSPLYRCIEVAYSGSVDPTPVVLYASGAPTGDLAPYLDLTVEMGPDHPDNALDFGDCTGFTSTPTSLYSGTLATFPSATSPVATTWDPAVSGEVRTFRFGITVRNDPAAQGRTTTFGFTWKTGTS